MERPHPTQQTQLSPQLQAAIRNCTLYLWGKHEQARPTHSDLHGAAADRGADRLVFCRDGIADLSAAQLADRNREATAAVLK